MDWLDTLLERGEGTKQPESAAPVVMIVWVQTRAPRGGDLGACEAGHYFVQDGTLVMCSEDGKPTGKTHALAAGETPKVIAGRFTRRAWEQGKSEFNRPLNYGPMGVA